jgi:protein SCO1
VRSGYHGNTMMAFRRSVVTLLLGLLMLPEASGAAGAPAPLPALERVTVMATPKPVANFTLLDQNGRPRTLVSLRGEPTLVFFGFTHCPDVCPATMTRLKLLHQSNGGALKAAHVILISVDGERDTPPVMKKYLASFSPDFIGLTGSPRAVADIAARFSAVAYKEQPDRKGNYEYFHSSQVFLVDKDGRLRASFADASVENMATVTRIVLEEKIGGARP